MSFANDANPQPLPRPQQLESLEPDKLVAVVLHLAMELSVMRDRLDSQEAILAEAGVLDRGAIENYRPAPEDAARRKAKRDELVAAIIERLR